MIQYLKEGNMIHTSATNTSMRQAKFQISPHTHYAILNERFASIYFELDKKITRY